MSGEGVEFPRKQLLLVGDRVLITPEEGDDRTRVAVFSTSMVTHGNSTTRPTLTTCITSRRSSLT